MIKLHTLSILFLTGTFLCGMCSSCTDDMTGKQSATVTVDDSNLVETRLSLNVTSMNTDAVQSRIIAGDHTGEMSDDIARGTNAERQIDNVWVFQFNTSGQLLITPRYYDNLNIAPDETTAEGVTVLLKPDVESTVYVVANTGSSTWATVRNSSTLTNVKELSIPQPTPITIDINGSQDVLPSRIPMEGHKEKVTPGQNETINVQVTRMYAKINIEIDYIPETLNITDVLVSNIPFYCRVSSLDNDDENPIQAADFPEGTTFTSRTFKPGDKNKDGKYTGTMTIYVPENLQGKDTHGAGQEQKIQYAKKNALNLNLKADYMDLFTHTALQSGRDYVFYPGANESDDYNIMRNHIYHVEVNIYTDIYEQDIPSSNCFVVKPGELLSFLPYYRTEEGGGHKFTEYLDPNGPDTKKINDSDKMLDNIKIIWQTESAIGDNSKGDLVWIDRRSEVTGKNNHPAEFYRKIYVKAGKEGNALIAAYNSNKDIVWSWHIWVTENDPANVSSAITYSTYSWNENGIQKDVRVPGYAIMPCNLGALAYEPDGGETANNNGSYKDRIAPKTHGMLYQWGRKDPFPPSINTSTSSIAYDDKATGYHYGNADINEDPVGKTSGTDKEQLFHSELINNITDGEIAFAVKNPTVFICGTNDADKSGPDGVGEGYVNNDGTNYPYRGDWQNNDHHDETLWGGLKATTDGTMKCYSLGINDGKGNPIHIFDNYGDQKSIYDPCPSGWRVPPGDLWLGFTEDGKNPVSTDYFKINTSTEQNQSKAGMYMYMNGWKTGQTIFFPTQGTRIPDGRIIRSASCGNYHNATTDAIGESQRVNILHIHNQGHLFRVFETTFYMYYVKSTAGPIRCVRDHK